MAQAQAAPATPPRRGDRTRIRSAHPGGEATKRLTLPRLTRISGDYVNATLGNKSGFATYSMTVGDVTYRAITFGIVSTAAVAGVTQEIAGKHYVTTDKLADYLSTVRLVANGGTMQELDMSELVIRNAYHGITFGPVMSGFAFPGQTMYANQRIEDAFALGTLGMRSLSLEIKLGAAFSESTMEVVVMPHAVDMGRSPGYTYTTERLNATFSGAGKHTYTDLPVGDDVKDVWIFGANIQHVTLTIDREVLFDCDRAQYEAWLTSNGRNVDALGGNWLLDAHADGIARSIAALDAAGERRRDARFKLEITTLDASTPVEFLVTHSDIYQRIR
ncbi:hypothetical protein [Tropicibacter alexandrii]|uniref:hypothetical protein n=1 Tax=Tropicibacter alexandrii TaxID=2267683 RepID=UPI000EF4586D|nr:hypothetical protein [Tropicibacter alexandrii]